MNVIASGELYSPGTDILFSTGKTAGGDVVAESEAMRSYFRRLFPDVPDTSLSIEDRSIDTASNAEEVAAMLAGTSYGRTALLSVSYHIRNAAILFRRNGIAIDETYASDEVLMQRSPHHQAFVMAWRGMKRIRQERKKEMLRTMLLHTVDPRGRLLHHVTSRSRARGLG